MGPDRLDGIVLDDDPDVIVLRGGERNPHIAVVDNTDHVVIRDRDDVIINDRDVIGHSIGGIGGGSDVVGRRNDGIYNRDVRNHIGVNNDDIGTVDVGALDRAIRERDCDKGILDRRLAESKVGIDTEDEEALTNLTLAKDDVPDFELDLESLKNNDDAEKKGNGLGKGDLYAYNYPSQGVGAGVELECARHDMA